MSHPKVVREHPERLGDDLIWGVKGPHGIAAEIGRSERETYYLISRKLIPFRKLGPKTIISSRSELRRHFATKG
jgi:hypothetical protein